MTTRPFVAHTAGAPSLARRFAVVALLALVAACGGEEKADDTASTDPGDTEAPPDTDEPTGDTDEPTGDTDEPTGDTDEPTGDTDEPTDPVTIDCTIGGGATLEGTGYLSVQDAIDAASPGDVIELCGTITEPLRISRDLGLVPAAGETAVLDATGLGTAIEITAGAVELTDLTILAGNGSSGALGTEGGGVLVRGSDPVVLTRVSITGGHTDYGGALHAAAGTDVTVVDGSFSGNVSDAVGGAIWTDGTMRLQGGTITGAQSAVGAGLYGGANSAVTVVATVVSSNDASDVGGGIASIGSLTVESATISDNSAIDGGGILADAGATLTVRTSVLSGNSATTGGGIAVQNVGTSAVIEDSVFDGNAATLSGGGLLVDDADMATIARSTFLANTAGSTGGGAFVDGTASFDECSFELNDSIGDGGGLFTLSTGDVSVTNSTFTANYTDQDGAGLCQASNGGTLTIADSTFTDNIADRWGGGVRLNDTAWIERVTMIGNVAEWSGAIDTGGSASLTLLDSRIEGNEGTTNAGGAYIEVIDLEMRNTDWIDNVATDLGGGIFYADVSGVAVIDGGLMQGNVATNVVGGAIFQAGGSMTMSNLTFLDNVAGLFGGAIITVDGDTTVQNSVFHRNSGPTGGAVRVDPGTTFTAMNVDFGTGVDDNTPDDIDVNGTYYWYDGVTNVACDGDAMTCM